LKPFIKLVKFTSPELPRQIANAHSIFNVAVSLILFPFVNNISKLSMWLAPEKNLPSNKLTAYIDYMQYRIPSVAIREARKELIRMGEMTSQMLVLSQKALLEEDMEAANWVVEKEDGIIDPVTDALETFVNGLLGQNLNATQHNRCFQVKNIITDIERVGDLTENLVEAAQMKVQLATTFSEEATKDLENLFTHAIEAYRCSLQALQTTDCVLAQRVCDMEDDFDHMYIEARQGHVKRLEASICQPEADVIFIETLRNLERISDHADNIGLSTIHNYHGK
jgi:phosphate:Na+ symporter